jgi:iron complex transport system substrate-binding protein
MQAVKHKRICAFTPAQGDVLVRPGPRLGEAADIIAQCLKRHYP